MSHIASGAQVFQALQARGHTVLAVDTAQRLLSSSEERELLQSRVKTLPPKTDEISLVRADTKELANTAELSDVDIFFLALHGGIGEDGSVQPAQRKSARQR